MAMRRQFNLFWCAFAMLAATLVAGEKPLDAQTLAPAAKRPAVAGPTAVERPIDQLGWLVGGTWTTQEKTDDGGTLTVKLICTWAETKQAVLYKVWVEAGGKETPQYDGMYVWNPEKKKFTLWQVNRKGEVAEGEVTLKGEEMDQLVRAVHPDGGSHFLKAHYTRLNKDEFRFKAWFRLSETAEWQDALDIVYERSR